MLFWISLFLLTGILTFYYSRLQPFPEIGGKFSLLVLILAIFLWITESSPRPGSEDFAPTLSLITGGLGVIIGIRHMGITKKDVILAPLGGVLFIVGGIWLLSSRWDGADQFQQISLFLVASILVALEIYLIFRGLVIGIPGVSWSKSGIRQIQRGLIEGPNGAIAHFEKALDKKDDKYEASLYLLKSYYFKSKFVVKDKKVKKDLLKKGKDLGLSLVEKFPNSVEYRYWYLVNLGSWAEEYGVFAAAREGVADQMRYHSKKIIEIDPYYENGAGYFLLGAVHYKAPYIPFILSWPNNNDALKYLELAQATGEPEIAQIVYYAQALDKDKNRVEAIKLLEAVIKRIPSADNFASDWEWIKKAKIILDDLKS